MPAIAIPRPETTEYAPFYAGYVAKVPAVESLVAHLEAQGQASAALLGTVKNPDYRYAPGKWSVKEIVGHVSDAERVFAYRLLCIARGESQPLPGFNEDAYVAAANFSSRSLDSLASELAGVRSATLRLLEGLDPAALATVGTASGKPISARALAYIIAGHEAHHVAVLKDRYAPAF